MSRDPAGVIERLRRAFEVRDLDALVPLLADDVRWGDDHHPDKCRNREQVLGTLSRVLSESDVVAEIEEMTEGPRGILCRFDVHWQGGRDESMYHVYLLRQGQIAEIRRYDDRPSAVQAVGL